MRRMLAGMALAVFAVVLIHRAVAAQGGNSPVGDWELTVIGSDRGYESVTFSNDFSMTGYGITRDSFGLYTLMGNWNLDGKGDVVAGFVRFLNGNGVAGEFTAKISNNSKLNAKAKTSTGHIRLKGESATDFPDISGNWVGEVKKIGSTHFESYSLTAVTNLPSVFNLTGQGVGAGGPYSGSGAIIVNSRNRAQGFTIADPNGSGSRTNSVAGKFDRQARKARLHGIDDNHNGVHIDLNRGVIPRD